MITATHTPGAHKEKGSVRGAALWVDHSAKIPAQSVSCFVFLRWRRFISPSIATVTNCPVLSPTSFKLSIASTKGSGTRASILLDFAFTDFVAIAGFRVIWCPTMINEKKYNSSIDVSHTSVLACVPHLAFDKVPNSEAQPDGTPCWASNHNVTEAYTMAFQHSTQTRPEKHLWRFLALDRADMNAIPHSVSVEAPTEHDARQVLAPYFILSFAARLPAQGVCNA